MFSFLNLSFDFTEGNSSSRSVSKVEPNKPWTWESSSSPMTSTATLTPRSEPFLTPPPAQPLESPPEACAAEICPAQGGVKKWQSFRPKPRRSSVFFKLPDLDKVLKGDKSPPPGGEGAADGRKKDDGNGHNNLAAKFSRPGSSRRRSRRASIAPGGYSPGRTRAARAAAAAAAEEAEAAAAATEQDDNTIERLRKVERNLDLPPSPIGAAAAAAAAAAGESVSCYDSKPSRRGALLLTVGEDGPAPEGNVAAMHRQDHPKGVPRKRPSPRSSPRALSAGHRRESCRDSRVINRAPKGLSATRLLDDAQDVARIRQQANLRAKMEGVCWVASNWRVGGRKGVLSGKRFLVLCDNIVWAELREADRRCSLGEGGTSNAGFMPIIALEGATVQHHEVATSNNGWVIEVVNPAEDVTLWLDPANPTALLRWGSVLCQALQQTMEDDDLDHE